MDAKDARLVGKGAEEPPLMVPKNTAVPELVEIDGETHPVGQVSETDDEGPEDTGATTEAALVLFQFLDDNVLAAAVSELRGTKPPELDDEASDWAEDDVPTAPAVEASEEETVGRAVEPIDDDRPVLVV